MKRKVKGISLVLVFSITLLLGACGNGIGRKGEQKSIYEQGLDVISLMEEMAKSENYSELYSNDPELKEIISAVGEGDYSQPKKVYRIKVPESMISVIAEMANIDSMSDSLREYVLSKAQATIATQINAAGGASMIAATSICTAGKTFVNEELTENTIYLYTYESGAPAVVSFTVGEGGAVSASGTFLFSEGFKTDTAEHIKQFFTEIAVEVTEIEK